MTDVQAPRGESRAFPVDVHAERSRRRLRIEWSDGHVSTYEFSYLREQCPCRDCCGKEAELAARPCVDGNGGPGTDLETVNMVGGSALFIVFDDKHEGGVYTFEYLRSICPCPRHTKAQ